MLEVEEDCVTEEMSQWPISKETVRCPFAFMAQARNKDPVLRFDKPNELGRPMYLVTGQRECAFILSHQREFGSDLAGAMPGFDKSAVPLPFPEVPSFHEKSVIFFAGGDDHRIKRKWSMELISRSRVNAWRPLIEARTDELLDQLGEQNTCDFRREFSDILPVDILKIILELPEEAVPILRRVSLAIATTDVDPNITDEQKADKAQAFADLFALNRRMLEQRFAEPGNDYISSLARTQVEQDGALDVNALSIHLQGIMFGGDHAVGAFLAYLLTELARRPELQQKLRAQPELIEHFIDETLRLNPPLPWLFRHCEIETQVGDHLIPAGSIMIVAMAAANRDPAQFPSPESFSLERKHPAHEILTLGRGVHRCVGEPLARAVGAIVVQRMLSRFSGIALDEQKSVITPELSYQFRCPQEVHLLLDHSRAGISG
ncbi:cytochrome P450 [Pseudomonas sp. R5(2019)]|uniref:cytochrome P450 n=1 Tax=Pseudomonas sp. R5(2019) TaxID=2697566 RepID=UPI001412F377|nr:cytochrome P450 [Pseudomonas sp. R5(2019)]NBA96552.1 cytochrome P450 [Pseudomonas sp. R5(2019)]